MVNLPNGLHGAYVRSQLGAAIGTAALREAVRDGRLQRFSRSVVVDARRSVDFTTRAAASLLEAGPDAALTGPSALTMYGCTAADPAPIHVLVPYHRKPRPRPGVKPHHGRYTEDDTEEILGLRVLVLDAALAEVLSRGARRSALACADQALLRLPEEHRPTFLARVEGRVRTRPDSRGRRQARTLLNLASGLAESPAESWMLLAMVDGGLPVPDQQYPVTDLAGRVIYRLDFAWPDVRVAVEYDGYAAHEGKAEHDAARGADLERRGWIVVRARAVDLTDPSRVVRQVNEAFRVRGLAA